MHALKDRIRDRSARIGVIGLGYVGLPLAVEFARNGFDVTGFDVDEWKVGEINAGRSYILDVPADEVAASVAGGACGPRPTCRGCARWTPSTSACRRRFARRRTRTSPMSCRPWSRSRRTCGPGSS